LFHPQEERVQLHHSCPQRRCHLKIESSYFKNNSSFRMCRTMDAFLTRFHWSKFSRHVIFRKWIGCVKVSPVRFKDFSQVQYVPPEIFDYASHQILHPTHILWSLVAFWYKCATGACIS
jgi:hypothetical protein